MTSLSLVRTPVSLGQISSLENLNDDVLGLICETVHELTKANAEWLASSESECFCVTNDYDSDSDIDSDLESELSSTSSDASNEYWSWPPFSLKPLSLTSRRIRAFCEPFLFQKFTISRPCDQLLEKLSIWNPRVYVRKMDISLYMGFQEKPDHLRDLPRTLAETMAFISQSQSARPRLNSLSMSIDEKQAHLLKNAISAVQAEYPRAIEFPGIRHLTIGPNNEFILKYCPNVETLIVEEARSPSAKKVINGEHSFRVIREAGKLKKLNCLVMRESWTEELMTALYEAVPNIQMLWLEEGPNAAMTFEPFLENIAKFQNLQKIGLASVPYLNEKIQPYFQDDYDLWVDQVDQAEKRIAEMILGEMGGSCKNVGEVWFGFRTSYDAKKARVEVNEEGRKTVQWSTGRPADGPDWE
ncbi:hypothetical protein K435DRAFT_159252 [Dendrothele bispora CBS 962.96]|uniref:Uncharacterized protein n=1 Tax=Dendrothele bispora (strain CBS 962.96) TaxID=1314807 RepID=A0A4S8MNZ8_DENBC|nr:hypothetical protein K435DRAFT_159252 [Dendrothele bispora CBS 962.96]